MDYVAAPSYKRAHIAMHYIFNAGNGNWREYYDVWDTIDAKC
jgi:hypothetical protein